MQRQREAPVAGMVVSQFMGENRKKIRASVRIAV